jgi:L-asparaginase/Glu-tRNA(Gln) amidotransferase subunit D
VAFLRHFWHLVTRFFGVLNSRPLGPRAQQSVNDVLTPAEAVLFWRQQSIDQRHAYEVAHRVREAVDSEDAVAAALLHDVGKRHSRLGPIARSLATVAGAVGLPMSETWRSYLEHEALGAADLREIEARPLAIAFAAGSPQGDPELWEALVGADDGKIHAVEKGRGKAVPGNSMPPEVNE